MSTYIKADEQDEVKKFAISDMKSFFLLFKFAKAQIFPYLLSLSLIFLASGLYILSARYSGSLVEMLKSRDFSNAYFFAGIILAFEFFAIFFSWAGRRTISKYSSLVILEIRKKLFSHLHNLPLSYFDRQPRGRIITRLTHDVEGIEEFFTGSMGKVLQAIFLIVASFWAMLVLDYKLALILILSLIPGILFIYFTRGMVRVATRNMAITSSSLNSRLSEFLDGMEVIRAFGIENWSKDKYKDSINEYKKSTLDANFLYAWTQPIISLLVYSPLFGLVYFGGSAVMAGTMELGIFIAFMRTCERFISPLMNLSREILAIQQSFNYTERVVKFLGTETEESTLGPDGKLKPKLGGDISFEKISMHYLNSDPVLKEINFKVAKGERIGLVGRTGSGKTSIVSLLCRLYPFQEGKIKFDGIDIESIEREYLRNSIGFVSQDVILFKGSLRDNLTMQEDIPIEEIELACEKSGLARVMKKNFLDLTFPVLDAGSNLSSGERQLVSLTRIFLKKPSILILDEATANIDQECEQVIHNAIFSEMEGTTTIIIAHRLETLKHCDRILVLEKGKIIEQGIPSDLLEKKGAFYLYQNI